MKILRSVILVFLLFVLSVVLLQCLYWNFVLSNSILVRSDEQFREYYPESEVIFVGDSHAEADVDPGFIKNSFNFATSGEPYTLTYMKLRHVLSYDNQVELVVLPIDLHSFSASKLECCTDYWFWHRYLSMEDFEEIDVDFSVMGYFFSRYFPNLGNGHEVLNYLVSGEREVVLGHVEDYSFVDFPSLNADERFEQAKLRVDHHFDNSDVYFSDFVYSYFLSTVSLLLENGIEVVLIKYPVSEEYQSYVNARYIKDIEAYYYQLLDDDIFEGVKILDYQDLYFDNPEYFSDPNHLNREGINAFMEILVKDLAFSSN